MVGRFSEYPKAPKISYQIVCISRGPGKHEREWARERKRESAHTTRDETRSKSASVLPAATAATAKGEREPKVDAERNKEQSVENANTAAAAATTATGETSATTTGKMPTIN